MHRSLVAALLFLAMLLPSAPLAVAQDDDPFADFDFQFLKAAARENPSIAGPSSGELPIEIGTTHIEPAAVDVRDFYARAQFFNPYAARRHLFDIGFAFRRSGEGEDFRLVIDSAGAWFFKQAQQPNIASGHLAGFEERAGSINEIELVASGDVGYFAVNGDYVSDLDLSARPQKGDIAIGAGFYAEDQVASGRTPYANFEVWSLDEVLPDAPVAAANLAQLVSQAQSSASVAAPFADVIPLMTGSVTGHNAGVDLRDFYAHAEFTNPYPASEHLWDIGFGFRADAESDLRIAVDSNGSWFLSRGSAPIYQFGDGAVLNTGPGSRNTLDLVAVGGIGYLAVNGAYVATLDLGARQTSGDVWVSSGFYQEDKIDGASTPFSAFAVWSLDPPDDDGGAVIVSGDDSIIFDLPALDGPDLFGVVSLTAAGDRTSVEIGTFEATGDEVISIDAGTCAFPGEFPAFDLNPIDPATLTSATTVDAPYAELTNGSYTIAVLSADAIGTVISCADIPHGG
jgi:hypothetical protein